MIAVLAENHELSNRVTDALYLWAEPPLRDRLLAMFCEALPAALPIHQHDYVTKRFILSTYNICWRSPRPPGWADGANRLVLDLYLQEIPTDKTCYSTIVGTSRIVSDVIIAPSDKRLLQALLYAAHDTPDLLVCEAHDLPNDYTYVRCTWGAPRGRAQALGEARTIQQRLRKLFASDHFILKIDRSQPHQRKA